MALYIIEDKSIVGITNDPAAKLPKDFYVVEGMEEPIEKLYFNGSTILRKPPKPSTNKNYNWDGETNSWKEGSSLNLGVSSEPFPLWGNLISELQESPVWAKVNSSASKTNAANFAVTLLLRVLDVTRKESDLLYAFNNLREVLNSAASLEDFNTSELEFIQASLTKNNFTITV